MCTLQSVYRRFSHSFIFSFKLELSLSSWKKIGNKTGQTARNSGSIKLFLNSSSSSIKPSKSNSKTKRKNMLYASVVCCLLVNCLLVFISILWLRIPPQYCVAFMMTVIWFYDCPLYIYFFSCFFYVSFSFTHAHWFYRHKIGC